MSGTALEHALVRDYLRDLDAACAALPLERAFELRDQITDHLDEALAAGADDQEVAAVLRRLGIERGGSDFQPLSYQLPGSIPPHQSRALRVLWTSTTCLTKGSSQIIQQLRLRMRIGLVSRTEVISLDRGWALSGPSRGACT